MKTKIEIEVSNIKVSKDGYYSFDWNAEVDGKKKKGSYDSSFSGQTASAFRSVLKRGFAAQLAIEQIFGF